MNAQRMRGEGKSYAEIAAEQGVSPTAVFYALNPHARKPGGAEGKQRSFYSSSVLWDAVCEIAWSERVSISSVVADILTGVRPPVTIGPSS